MKEPNYLNVLDYFFNDTLGSFIPGFVFLSGSIFWCYFFGISVLVPPQIHYFGKAGIWLGITIYSFIFGHFFTSIYQILFQTVNKLFLTVKKSKLWNWIAIFEGDTKKEDDEKDTYDIFLNTLLNVAKGKEIVGLDKVKKREIRSIAMSMNKEGQRISVRFMFISLLCNGVGMATICILFVFYALHWFVGKAPGPYECSSFWYSCCSILFSYVLFRRGHEFYGRSFRAPFSVALTDLIFPSDD